LSSLHAFLRDYLQFNYSVPEIVEKYRKWVSEDKYMILNRVELKAFQVRDNKKKELLTVSLPVKSETFAVKCSKRGNDVYRFRVYRRFKGLASLSEKLVFFNPKDREIKKTRALFVTFTYDPKRCSYNDAWYSIGVDFNRSMAYIRKRFGKVSCCRVFEAYNNGYPHIHAVLLFEEKEFSVFRDRKGKFRIHEKEIFAEGWHSFVDVQAISSLGRGLSYLKKYLLKSIDAENKDSLALKTLALLWAFKKRTFSVSGKFRQLLTDLIKSKHNSNHKTNNIRWRNPSRIRLLLLWFCSCRCSSPKKGGLVQQIKQ
jgi:hypothetical protein